ncbi:hypothetical protein AWH56_011950 [Anaerobacillus isosaccharinicus]|uniref:Uncharacterized protein n=1 Tax=Anaerobacillus isosaccharinicus TaxID=1532552 RepID=A0A1S2M8M1_9BACI|nr:hypothetical protein [Anaerobacillus isosaccharinicus]MBA5588388.1 hypothetical protein [Anaerobacillus isosaccharinicus]QOY38180.1 hypothetical protein AWH56_011950 [Anaerobacillus isosaccharinicus]
MDVVVTSRGAGFDVRFYELTDINSAICDIFAILGIYRTSVPLLLVYLGFWAPFFENNGTHVR